MITLLYDPFAYHFLNYVFIMQMDINVLDLISFCMSHYSFRNAVINPFACSYRPKCMPGSMKGHLFLNMQVLHDTLQVTISRLIGYRRKYILRRFTFTNQCNDFGRYDWYFISNISLGTFIRE